jgi:ureidoacrylate peracid hydrolase
MHPLTRQIPLVPAQSALLFIDVQNFAIHRQGGEFRHLSDEQFATQYGWFFHEFYTRILPNMQAIQAACRHAGVEVMYTTIESLTLDGRDCSLDYKITGFHVPKGSWDGKVIAELAPLGDEIVLPKSSSSVFVSTHIDYILRNLGVKQLVISGLVTDQCVESAIRDACDIGYCRQITTAELLAELALATM